MSLDAIARDIERLEALAARVAAAGAARKAVEAKFDAATSESLSKAFPDAARMTAFATAMPAAPDLKAILAAFPNPSKLGDFVTKALGGDPKLFAVLAEKGCKRDPARLAALATAFETEPEKLDTFVKDGGLAAQPDALAAMLEGGCDADPAAFKAFVGKFPDEAALKKLARTLGPGGLGQSPEALGVLAKEGGGDLLVTLTGAITSDADLEKLGRIVNEGGLNGAGVGRPAMLRDVLVDGLGSDPAQLLTLHDQFGGTAPGAMSQLGRMLGGMDGGDGAAGRVMGQALAGFRTRQPGCTQQQAIGKLKDPFMKTLDSLTSNSARLSGPGAAGEVAANALAARPAPPAAIASGKAQALIGAGDAASLLSLGAPPAEAEGLARTAEAILRSEARGASISGQAAPVGPSATDTAALTAQLKLAADAVAAQPAGAPADETSALAGLIDPLLDAADAEPDGGLRKGALDAASAAAKVLAAALSRRAASRIAAGGPAGAAALAISASVGRAATPEARTALTDIAGAAFEAAAVKGAAGVDAKIIADEARKALAGDATSATAAEARLKALTDQAGTLKATLDAARPPLDASLLTYAAGVARQTVEAAQACENQGEVAKGLTAAAALSDAIGLAGRKAAAAHDAQSILSLAEGKAAVSAAADSDRSIGLLSLPPTDAAKLAAQGKARDAALSGALTLKDVDALAALNPAEQKAAAEAALRYKLAAAGTAAPDSSAVNSEAMVANAAATAAALAADSARTMLNGASFAAPPPNSYETLIERAAAVAQAAFEAASQAPGDVERSTALAAAKAAANEATAATRAFAAHAVAEKKTATRADQRVKATAAVGPRDGHIAAASVPNATAAVRAIDAALASVTANATTLLAEMAATGPAAAACSAAVEARIRAEAPGASALVEIEALEAQRAADKALATVAAARFQAALGAPALTATPLVVPAGMAAAEAAMAGARAAMSAVMTFLESAGAVKPAVDRALAKLQALPAPQQTAKEQSDIAALTNRPVPSQPEVVAAEAMRAALVADQNTLRTVLGDLAKNARPTGGAPAPALLGEVQIVAGLAEYASLERENGPAASLTEAEMIRTAAQMEGRALPGPVNAAFNAVPTAAENLTIDMAHFAERHMRETFDHDGAAQQADLMIGAQVKAKYRGTATPNGRPKKLETAYARAKMTTLFPEKITMAQVQALAEQATTLVKATIAPQTIVQVLVAQITAGPPPPPVITWNKAYKQYTGLTPAGPPAGLTVKTGYELTAAPPAGTASMRQLFPQGGPGLKTLTASDMKTLATALGH